MSLTPAELIAGRPLWLLEVSWLGRVYRWASELPTGAVLKLTDAAGDVLEYRGGLDLSWISSFALFDESPAPPVLSLELYFADLEDVPARIAQGHDLSTMTATLYRWATGMSHDDRRPVFFGEARDPSYGSVDEPVAVSFEAPLYRDGAVWPDARLSTDQIAADADLADGSPYPVVFGAPGYDLDSGTPTAQGAGSPALPYDATNRYLLAGIHYGTTPAQLWNASTDSIVTATTDTVADLQGRRIVRYQVTSALDWDSGASWAVAYTGDGYGAGDLIALCARQSTLRVDLSRLEVVAPYLNAWKLSGYVDDDGIQPWDWALRNVVPLLPVSAYHTDQGVALRVWNDRATASDAVASLSTSQGITRIGPVQYESGDLINELTIRYAPSLDGDYQRETTVTGREGIGGILNPYCVASRSRLAALDAEGPRAGVRAKTIETPLVWDSATALRILSWQVRAKANRRRVVTYEDTDGKLEWLEEADHVLLTDPELHLTNALAMVRARRWQGARVLLDLALIDEVGRAG